MWFNGRRELTAEQRAAMQERQRHAAAEAEIQRKVIAALKQDPAFNILTIDGTSWICPYTLTLVPAAFGHLEPARDYLMEKRPFRNASPRPVPEIERHAWRLYFKASLEFEPRLRITGPDQLWLNPWTGQWVKLTVRPPASPADVIDAVIGVVMTCPQARKGQMLDERQLREIEARIQRGPVPGKDLDTAHVSKHIAGRSSSESGRLKAGGDLDRAKSILERMLAELPPIPGFGLSVHYEPHNEIGGDFFITLPLAQDRYLLAVADVAGHGVQGALVVVAALKALRFIVRETQDLCEILSQLNDSVKADLIQGQFITCWMAVLQPSIRRLEMICAGHHACGIVNSRRDQLLRRVSAKGPALGLLPTASFRSALRPITIDLEPGDILLQYTDGLSECSDAQDHEYGELRALGSLVDHADSSHDHIVDQIAADARRFALGSFHDDVTVLALQCDPPSNEAGASEPQS